MKPVTLSITGALVALIAGAILRYQDLISNQFLITAAVVVGFWLLACAFGIGMTEIHKRAFIPRPWTVEAAHAMAESHAFPAIMHTEQSAAEQAERKRKLLAQAQQARDRIWFAATLWGGAPYTALLVIYFWPHTLLSFLLTVIAGVGLGGALLPIVYRLLINDLWPWMRARFLRIKETP